MEAERSDQPELPLTGAVLALRSTLEKIIQPLIAAYWSRTGQLSAMRQSVYLGAIDQAVPTEVVTSTGISAAVLIAHMVSGLVVAWIGC